MSEPTPSRFELSPEKMAVLRQRMRQAALKNESATQQTTNLTPMNSKGVSGVGDFPLSYAQERYWFLNQFSQGKSAYNITVRVEVQGCFSLDRLQEAFQVLVRRHSVLRTALVEQGQGLVQRVVGDLRVPFSLHDFSSLSKAERELSVQRFLEEESERNFDLSAVPLWRVAVLRKDSEEHVIVFSVHHCILDAESFGILFQEWSQVYKALEQGVSVDEEGEFSPYSEYAAWQRSEERERDEAEALKYWKRHLALPLPILQVPMDRSGQEVRGAKARRVSRVVGAEGAERVRKLALKENCSSFMVWLAGYSAWLARCSQQEDLCVGIPVSNRVQERFQNTVGLFQNILPFRLVWDSSWTGLKWIRMVRDWVLESHEFQQIPFERIVEEVHPDRDPDRHPIFQNAFMFQSASDQDFWRWALKIPQCRVSSHLLPNHQVKFDLACHVEEFNDRVVLTLEYNPEQCDESTMNRWLEHFETLMMGMADKPERAVSRLPMLGIEERRLLVSEWNRTEREYPRDWRVQEWIERQCAATPTRVALRFGEEFFSYGDLKEMTDSLALYLRKRGVTRGQRVGLCLARNPFLVVGLLAIVKAGGVYVPLDPRYPTDRIRFLVEDSEMVWCLTESTRDVSAFFKGTVLCVDHWQAEFIRKNSRDPQGQVELDRVTQEIQTGDPVYMIYTSGSTGKPKGVSIHHQALVNFLESMRQEPGMRAEDRCLALTTISFDTAGLEVFLPLVTGAEIVLADELTARDGHRLRSLLEAHRVTVLQGTPSTWRLLLEAGWKGSPEMTLLCGGEGMPLELARELVGKGKALWNLYGPTETTIWSTVKHIPQAPDLITVGRPIANTQVYLVDSAYQLVPLGLAGELCLGGDGLAEGYWKRPELTAEKWVELDLGDGQRAKVYRTGDLARYLPDGDLEILGRIDFQVKIRGFRIELGEIETALVQAPGVRAAVVTAVDKDLPTAHLAAYLLLQPGASFNEPNVREFLGNQVPEYMMPGAYVVMDSFPLTPNGKIDRKALPRPEVKRSSGGIQVAGGDLECCLAGLWEEVLQKHPIGVHDNFFALGGHSLLALRLVHRMEEMFNQKYSVEILFRAPTIHQLALQLKERGARSNQPRLIPLRGTGAGTPLFCLTWIFQYMDIAARLPDDLPVYSVNIPVDFSRFGVSGQAKDLPSIEWIAQESLKLIRAIQPSGPYYLMGLCFGGVVAYELARQIRAQGDTVNFLGILDSVIPRGIRTYTPFQRKVAFWRRQWSELRQQGWNAYFHSKRGNLARRWNPHAPMVSRISDQVPTWGVVGDAGEGPSGTVFWKGLWAMIEAYHPKPYDGDLVLFRAMNEPPQDDCFIRADRGWKDLTRGRFLLLDVPGSHETFWRQPLVSGLAAQVANHCRPS